MTGEHQINPLERLPQVDVEGAKALALAGLTSHAARGHDGFVAIARTFGEGTSPLHVEVADETVVID